MTEKRKREKTKIYNQIVADTRDSYRCQLESKKTQGSSRHFFSMFFAQLRAETLE